MERFKFNTLESLGLQFNLLKIINNVDGCNLRNPINPSICDIKKGQNRNSAPFFIQYPMKNQYECKGSFHLKYPLKW